MSGLGIHLRLRRGMFCARFWSPAPDQFFWYVISTVLEGRSLTEGRTVLQASVHSKQRQY